MLVCIITDSDIDNKRNSRKIIKWILIVVAIFLALVVIGVVIFGYTLLNMVNEVPLVVGPEKEFDKDPLPTNITANPEVSLPSPSPTNPPQKVILDREDLSILPSAPLPKDTGITNILLFGLDRRASNEGARSDVLMIATIDKKNNQVKLTSLMRDMYVPIPGRQDNRINTGYIFGGPTLAIKTVNQNFDMNIEHYVTIDFFGFEQIIDILGGVEVTVTAGEATIIGLDSAGTYTLDGDLALSYSRICEIGGDYERTDRQRLVLNTLFNRTKTVSLLKVPELLTNILPYIETNLSKGEMLALVKSILDSSSNPIQDLRLPLEGAYKSQRIRNMAVLVPDLESNTAALHEFIYGDKE